MPSYTLKPGFAYKRPAHGNWRDAEIVVLPQRAEGASKVFGFITIDDAKCVVIQTPVGRFAQTVVTAQVRRVSFDCEDRCEFNLAGRCVRCGAYR